MPTFKDRLRSLVRDRSGTVVFGEAPNLPILIALAGSIGTLLLAINSTAGVLCAVIAFGAWFTWAWLELFDGTTPLRRILGGIVIGALVIIATVIVLQLIVATSR